MTAYFFIFWPLWQKTKIEWTTLIILIILQKKTDIFYRPISILQRAPYERTYIGSARPSLYTKALTGATRAARQAVQGKKILLEYGKLKSKQLFWALLPAHIDLKLWIPFGNVMAKYNKTCFAHLFCAELWKSLRKFSCITFWLNFLLNKFVRYLFQTSCFRIEILKNISLCINCCFLVGGKDIAYCRELEQLRTLSFAFYDILRAERVGQMD